MKAKPKANMHRQRQDIDDDDFLNGYPSYPPTEDIYGKYQKERDLNPEEPSKTKKFAGKPGEKNTKDYSDDLIGDDLDVPGSEDDDLEQLGDEDEENNYYSLGGDNHNDLEEDGDY
jgi:hypothetical protein